MANLVRQLGVMEKSGGWHYYRWDRDKKEGVMAINGARAAMQFLRENADVEAQIRAETMEAIKNSAAEKDHP